MGRCHSLDLRERVVAFVAEGRSRRSAARQFAVSASCAVKLLQQQDRTGSPAPARQGRPLGSGQLMPFEGFLIGEVKAKPDMTMPELAERLLSEHGVKAAPAVLSRLLCRRRFTYKKALMAAECARTDVCEARLLRKTKRQPTMRAQPHWLVFLDETSVTTTMNRPRGRSMKGDRLRATAPFGHWGTQTFIAAVRCHGLTAP